MEDKEQKIKEEDKIVKEESTAKKDEILPEKKEVLDNKEAQKTKKEFAIAKGISMRISTKDSIAICRLIKGKSPKNAIGLLEKVVQRKMPLKMPNREVPHQKGLGVSSARYPRNACLEIIKLIKQLEANAVVLGIENPVITLAVANIGSRPYRRGGTRAKRTNILLEAREIKTKLTN